MKPKRMNVRETENKVPEPQKSEKEDDGSAYSYCVSCGRKISAEGSLICYACRELITSFS